MTKTRAIRQARTFFGTRRRWRKFPRPRRLLSIVPTDQTFDWTYDSVGNRLTQNLDKGNDGIFDELTSYVYDVNDRLIDEIFDSQNDGTFEKATVYGYDHTQQTAKTVTENGVITSDTSFEYNALGQMSVVTITKYTDGIASSIERTTYGYGSNGIRVSALHEIDSDADGTYETATLTEYLNDPNNHTGYSQVLKTTEYSIDGETRTITKEIYYTIGLDQIAQSVTAYIDGIAQETETHYFTYDGHGSTRALLGAIAAVLQLYSFDAYGNALGFNTNDALTEYLYSGEQFDSKIGQQYLRARYYNPATGRFNSLDSFFGNIDDPQSLHKYLYTHADPINGIDPTGRFGLGGVMISAAFNTNFQSMSVTCYSSAQDLAIRGLDVLQFKFFVDFITAYQYIQSPPPYVSAILCTLPLIGVLAKTNTLTTDDIRNFIDLGKWQSLSDSTLAGHLGEEWAKRLLVRKGYDKDFIIAVQNKSNHGIDIVARKNNQWFVFEVKSHIEAGSARLSNRQKVPTSFVDDILKKINTRDIRWNNLSPKVLHAAKELENYRNLHPDRIRSIIINVDFAVTIKPLFTVKRWKK